METERKIRENQQSSVCPNADELRYRVEHDSLTGLYNRETFFKKTGEFLQKNPTEDFLIMEWEVESLQAINELFGEKAGDGTLKYLADLLIRKIGKFSVIGRQKSNQFIICTKKSGIRPYLDELEEFLENGIREIGNHIYQVQMHVGIYEIEDRTMPIELMLDRVEIVLSTIRDSYISRVAYYNEELKNKLLEEQELSGEMEQALKEHQFYINLQPVYAVATGLPVSAEALVRWRHPQKGIISPGKFIPLFEKNGFVMKLDRYVWEEVCKMLADFKSRGINIMPISINISRVNFYSMDLCDFLLSLIQKYGLDTSCLKLEITESAYTDNSSHVIETVENLQKNGFKVMMDDFGSGYSSLNMLRNLYVDILKLDMAFVQNLEVSDRASNILAYVVRMAKALDMEIVAEGVETENQRDFLAYSGCDCIQGYYYSKPLSVEDYEALLCSRDVVEHLEHPIDDKRCILIVDDMEISRDAIACTLGEDYNILEAENGKRALEMLKENSQIIDIVITDINMPEMDGFELLDNMHEDAVLHHIPTVVVTANNHMDDEIKALEKGAIDVIIKPFDPYEIKQRVKNLIRLVEAENIKYDFMQKDEKK